MSQFKVTVSFLTNEIPAGAVAKPELIALAQTIKENFISGVSDLGLALQSATGFEVLDVEALPGVEPEVPQPDEDQQEEKVKAEMVAAKAEVAKANVEAAAAKLPAEGVKK